MVKKNRVFRGSFQNLSIGNYWWCGKCCWFFRITEMELYLCITKLMYCPLWNWDSLIMIWQDASIKSYTIIELCDICRDLEENGLGKLSSRFRSLDSRSAADRVRLKGHFFSSLEVGMIRRLWQIHWNSSITTWTILQSLALNKEFPFGSAILTYLSLKMKYQYNLDWSSS